MATSVKNRGSTQGNTMNIRNSFLLVCAITGLSFSASASAYINHLDSYDTPVTHNRLKDISETNAAAEEIWNRLTSEFVTQFESGNVAQAANVAQTAYELAENSFGPNDVNTADSMLKLGIVNESLGNFSLAKEYMLGALVILRDSSDTNQEDIAVIYTNLANLYFEQNLLDESEKYHEKALKIRRRVLGDSDPAVAQSMYNLAVLFDETTQYDKAQPYYEQALKIWYGYYGPNHPYVANTLNNLANVYASIGDNESAVEMHKHSLSIRRKIYGNMHAETARSLINLGKLYVKMGRYQEATPVYLEAINVAEQLFGPSHPQVAMLLYSLANVYHIQARIDKDKAGTQKASLNSKHHADELYAKAMPLYERALRIMDKTIGRNHPAVMAMMNEMSMLYKSVGNKAKMTKMLARINGQKHGADIPQP